MNTIFKTYRAQVKEPDEDGSLNMYIPVSTDSVDRDSEVIEPIAFKKTIPKFMKHPVLVASHDYRDLTNQIGEWSKVRVSEDGKGIEGKPKYYIGMGNEQADWAYKLAQKGVAAFSIGFIPKEWEDGDGTKAPRRTYKEVELLEISQVIIPSNREAIQNIRSKSVDPIIKEICDAVEKDLSEETPEEYAKRKWVDEPREKAGLSPVEKGIVTKPEETENFIHIPAKGEEGKHEGHRIRTIPIDKDKGISARYCGEDKKIISYMFAKDHDWTMAKAQAWVKEHEGKSIDIEHEISQEEIIDEIDYLNTLIKKEGLSGKARESAELLTFVILHSLGYSTSKHYEKIDGKIIEIGYIVQDEKTKRLPVADTTVEKKKDIEKPVEKIEPTEQEILDEIKNINIGGK